MKGLLVALAVAGAGCFGAPTMAETPEAPDDPKSNRSTGKPGEVDDNRTFRPLGSVRVDFPLGPGLPRPDAPSFAVAANVTQLRVVTTFYQSGSVPASSDLCTPTVEDVTVTVSSGDAHVRHLRTTGTTGCGVSFGTGYYVFSVRDGEMLLPGETVNLTLASTGWGDMYADVAFESAEDAPGPPPQETSE